MRYRHLPALIVAGLSIACSSRAAAGPDFGYVYTAATEEAGYRVAYSFLNGRIVSGMNRYRLPRLNMTARQRRSRSHIIAQSAGSPELTGELR